MNTLLLLFIVIIYCYYKRMNFGTDLWIEIFKWIPPKSLRDLSLTSKGFNLFVVRILTKDQLYLERMRVMYSGIHQFLCRPTNSCSRLVTILICRTLDTMTVLHNKSNLNDYAEALFKLYECGNGDSLLDAYYRLLSYYKVYPPGRINQCDCSDMLLNYSVVLARFVCYCMTIDKGTLSNLCNGFLDNATLNNKRMAKFNRFVNAMKSIGGYSHFVGICFGILAYPEFTRNNIDFIKKLFSILNSFGVTTNLYDSSDSNSNLFNSLENEGNIKFYKDIDLESEYRKVFVRSKANANYTMLALKIYSPMDLIREKTNVERKLGRMLMVRQFYRESDKEKKIWTDIEKYVDGTETINNMMKYSTFGDCDTILEVGISDNVFKEIFNRAPDGWRKRLILDPRAKDL
jgi:hypothetical protein